MRKRERRAGVGTGAVEGSHGEERNESVDGKDRVHVSKWNSIRKCSYAFCLAATGHRIYKHLGSTLQSDGGMSTEINKRIQCGWNNWRKMAEVLCDKRVPPHVKGKIHKMVVQPAMLYGMETVPVTSSHVKKLEVTEMKMCRWACGHTLRDHVRNENIKERLNVESIAERCRKARLSGWPRKEARPRLSRKKDSGDGTTGRRKRGSPKQRWMDCVNRDMRAIGTTKDEVHDRTGWRIIVSAAATTQPSGSG